MVRFIFLLVISSVSFAQNSPIIIVNIESNNDLSWNFYSPDGQLTETIPAFGKLGDHLMPGTWASGSLALISEGDDIEWKIRGNTGEVSTIVYGKKKDILVGGGDFNGDGVDDPVRIRGRNMVWIAKGIGKTKLGSRDSDKPFFVNLDGARDRAAVLRGNKIFIRDLVTKDSSSITLRKTFINAPLPIKQKNGKDLLAFIESDGTTSQVFLVRPDGRTLRRRRIQASGTAIVGDFLPSYGEEIAIQSEGGFEIINPRSGEVRSLALPDGIPVDNININSFTNGETCSNENRSPRDGNEGFLWKPISETTGKLVILFPSALTGKIDSVKLVFGSSEEFGRSGGVGNGNREHFRFQNPGPSYPDNTKVVAILKAGCVISYTIPDTSVRLD